jgi:hypothetical protein
MRARAGSGRRGLRRLLVGVLVVLSCLTLVAGTLAVWARSVAFDTDRWVATVGPLIEEPRVVDTVSARAATAVVEGLGVEDRVRAVLAQSDALSGQAGTLAGSVADAVERRLRERFASLLATRQARDLWFRINAIAHRAAVAVLRGETPEGISVEGGVVTLDLVPLIELGLSHAEDLLTDVLGRPVDLPDPASIPAEELAGARGRIEAALDVDLPEGFGRVVVLRSDRLAAAQDLVSAVDRGIAVVIGLTVALMAAAILLSPSRRRTLVQLGFGVVLAFLLARAAVRAVGEAVVDGAPVGQRGAVRDVVDAVVSGLVDFTTVLLVAGLLVGTAAYLAGRPAWLVRLRAGAGPPLREAAAVGWAAAHRAGVRFAIAVAAVLVLYVVELSWASVAWVAGALVALELAVTYLAGPRPAALGPADRPVSSRSGR